MSRRKPYSEPLSQQAILNLKARAVSGDQKAYDELIARNKALASRANKALTRLEEAGFERYAYNRAQSYISSETGGTRFTTSRRKLSWIEDVATNVQEISKFLKAKSSTVSGNKMIDAKILNAFRERGVVIDRNQENEFLDLIASDEFETLKKDYVDSNMLVKDLVTLSAEVGENISFADIQSAFNRVTSGKETYDVALEKLGVII